MLWGGGGEASGRGIVALVTGANGGIGFAVAERLCEWARGTGTASPFPAAQLTLVLGCRNAERARAAQEQLLQAHPGAKGEAQDTLGARIDVQTCLMDLSSCASVLAACQELRSRFGHLDYLVLNAGIIPIQGTNMWRGLHNLLTRPAYMAQTGGDVIVQHIGLRTPEPEALGLAFAANFFGHFLLVRELEALLQASGDGRVLWFSSTTAAVSAFFDPEDPQCLHGDHPYESSKRLCELISAELGRSWREQQLPITSFVVSPGNCLSGITQGSVNALLVLFALYVMRLMCCSGINIHPRNGTTAAMHLLQLTEAEAVQAASTLSPRTGAQLLWHAEMSPLGRPSVRRLPLQAMPEGTGAALLAEMDALRAQHAARYPATTASSLHAPKAAAGLPAMTGC